MAKDGHIVFNGADRNDQQIVFGDITANGLVVFEDKKDGQVTLTDSNVGEYMAGSEGMIRQDLYGTMNEIPDFTNLGGEDQLFDFDRFYAAAEAGSGQVFQTLDEFRVAMADANSVGETLEGITVLNIDPSVEGNGPKLDDKDLPEGINITGTIFMNFADGTDLDYKLFIETPLNVNAADLTDWDALDESTYTSGYPGLYTDEYKMPSSSDITPNHENFVEEDDLPAVIFNTGIVDIHGAANVCGVVYGPSFIEIENHGINVQYFNGAIYGGGGVYFDGRGNPLAIQAIRFDPETTDQLQTTGGMAQALVRTGFAILK